MRVNIVETETVSLIANHSLHPTEHKLAAFHSLVHMTISLLLSKVALDKEIQTIKNIAMENGYNVDLINKLYSKNIYSKQIKSNPGLVGLIDDLTKTIKNKSYRPINYIGALYNKIRNILKLTNMKL